MFQDPRPIAPSPPRTLIPNVQSVPNVISFKSLIEKLSLPVLLLTVKKEETYSKAELKKKLGELEGMEQFKAVFLFNEGADLNDLFMLVWLIGGNIEPERDVTILNTQNGNKTILVDATIKTLQHDHFGRDWPNVVTMNEEAIAVIDGKWTGLGLGRFQPSPSLKYKLLEMGAGATYTC